MKFNLFNKDWLFVILICLGIGFFCVYSYLTFSTPEIFNSPDETANYFFTKNYSQTGQISFFEPLNILSHGVIHPRSVISHQGYVMPVSFLGMIIIYGFLAKIFGSFIILYLTPLFAVLGVLVFYGLLKNIFNRKVAFISSLILFFHPAFWYFSERTMMHNVLFVSLLIIGLYFISALKKIPKDKKKFVKSLIYYCLAGLFIGLALTVRLSEIFWVFILLLIIFLSYITKVRWLHFACGMAFLFTALVPNLYYNQILYGGFLKTGYDLSYRPGQNIPVIKTDFSDKSNLVKALSFLDKLDVNYLAKKIPQIPWAIIFPFGLNMKNVYNAFSSYILGLFNLFNILFLFGLILFIYYLFRQEKRKAGIVFFASGLFVSAFLLIFYGSWEFYDNINKQVSIGTSYIRYWLAIYIFMIVIISFVLAEILHILRKYKMYYLSVLAFVLFFIPIIYFSVDLVCLSNSESLVNVQSDLWKGYNSKNLVNLFTEPESLIIVDRADKTFFPQRKVAVFMMNYDLFNDMPYLARKIPVYYYTMMSQKDIDYINASKIGDKGIKFVDPVRINKDFQLFKLVEEEETANY